MKMSKEERALALEYINLFVAKGLVEFYKKSRAERRSSLWDWYDDAKLENSGFNYADGATKTVLINDELDWVIKFVRPDEERDWCGREYENYVLAEEAGLGYYFAATEYLCEVEGIRFYAQEMVICDESVDSSIADSYERRLQERGEEYDIDSIWEDIENMDAADRVELLYGNTELCQFVWDRRINDLHCGNFGIAGDRYVMIDYSGFGRRVWED